MADNMCTYLELELLDHALGTGAFPIPTAVNLALHSADPGEDATGAELAAASGYAREAIAFSAASGSDPGSASNSGTITFTASGGAWTTVTHATLQDSATEGDDTKPLFYGPLTASKKINDGDSLEFAAGAITISLN